MPGTNEQWAVAMFSFTSEIVRGTRRPQQLLSDAREAGLAERFEIDGFQHFSTFPAIGSAEADRFCEDVSRLKIRLTELGIYDDLYVDPRRVADVGQRVSYLERQIESAHRLGFPAVKIMWGVDLEVLEGIRPCLERLGLRLYQEAQGALRADSSEVATRVDLVLRHPSVYGFVFDLSASMYGLPVTYLEDLRRLRVPEEVVRILEEAWPSERGRGLRDHVLAATEQSGLSATARLRLMMPFGRFGNSHVSEWRHFLPLVDIVHLKFWDLVDDNGIVSAPMRDLTRELKRSGFAGPLTSEWGGHEWLEGDNFQPIAMTRKHRSLYEAVAVP